MILESRSGQKALPTRCIKAHIFSSTLGGRSWLLLAWALARPALDSPAVVFSCASTLNWYLRQSLTVSKPIIRPRCSTRITRGPIFLNSSIAVSSGSRGCTEIGVWSTYGAKSTKLEPVVSSSSSNVCGASWNRLETDRRLCITSGGTASGVNIHFAFGDNGLVRRAFSIAYRSSVRPIYPTRILLLRSSTMGKPWNLLSLSRCSASRTGRSEAGRDRGLLVMTRDTGTLKTWSSLLSKKGNPLNQIVRSAMPPFPKRSLTALVTPTTI